jgi:hypothetical protein
VFISMHVIFAISSSVLMNWREAFSDKDTSVFSFCAAMGCMFVLVSVVKKHACDSCSSDAHLNVFNPSVEINALTSGRWL